ncbi:chemotaxis protein CheE [Brevundimonas lenta]|uniref:Chemotaxis protein CheE n=1 Tax=Brevundimonas lenta TaxID=424796 RepID=A0A7W6NPW4_9CAUL|nr:chemotaxis protein CheE [Brevundimonas lenta]MBB4083298.1 hypothetical protein [Brevundimonas lenta]
MTVITHARRASRLAKLIDTPGGVSIGTALAQAKSNLEALQPRSLEEVAKAVAELGAIQPPATPEDGDAALTTAYHAASRVIDAVGPFGLEDIRLAALGLCELIDATSADKPFDWRVLPVYAQSLQLLLSLPAEQTDARAKVRASLGEMVDRKLAQTG